MDNTDSLAVRRVRQNIQVTSLADTPREQAIDGNSIVQEFVWKLKRDLYGTFNLVIGKWKERSDPPEVSLEDNLRSSLDLVKLGDAGRFWT